MAKKIDCQALHHHIEGNPHPRIPVFVFIESCIWLHNIIQGIWHLPIHSLSLYQLQRAACAACATHAHDNRTTRAMRMPHAAIKPNAHRRRLKRQWKECLQQKRGKLTQVSDLEIMVEKLPPKGTPAKWQIRNLRIVLSILNDQPYGTASFESFCRTLTQVSDLG